MKITDETYNFTKPPPYKISSYKCIYNIEYMLVITAQNAENFKKYVKKRAVFDRSF